ncbi:MULTISPECIES: DUF4389 domain-containing protein [unclassified Actinopolyspora]|uniref:DUF4389 domain-containing protein n=1 Tax=unclassified Actinopolyspora TaxID=2639451 RepID=UPI0013F649A7|nr:DUF4389 domain-containing protein [Actinopolyspora sp. BKK2]NHE78692.1 DUF4389 domain-containing protein [Actinopolyspora sp. BKK1]
MSGNASEAGSAGSARQPHPVRFEVEYPDRELDRVGTVFRLILAVPILVVLSSVGGQAMHFDGGSTEVVLSTAGGTLFVPPLLMLLFRRKYPRWWFDWNRELLRFTNRVIVYLALLDDRYPSTDEHQAVRLDFAAPEDRALNRWFPLVKWLLAVPHYVVLFFLDIAAVVAVVAAWFAIVFTGRHPRGLFDFLVGVGRWHNRVIAYAWILVTDRYPPFRLAP